MLTNTVVFPAECQSFARWAISFAPISAGAVRGRRVRYEIPRSLESDIIRKVKGQKKRKTVERPVFDSIRKPTAPPGRKFGADRPDEKLLPSQRKAKHKRPPDTDS